VDYEKLGYFYMGRVWDPSTGRATTEDVLYDSRDLTTHAVCVGMTGSGKTGLCLALIEEAAIDGIPAIVVDPKGDLANLMLTFPELRDSDFRPWVDEGEAARRGLTSEAQAAAVAKSWREGLAAWGQDGARIARFANSVERRVFTPGSSAGIPVNILRSLAAPPIALRDDPDALRERVTNTAAGLLALLGLDADPLRSREHVLLATLLGKAWAEGRDMTIEDLVRQVQAPPFERVGVLDLESFYPTRDRAGFAMGLNNLLASPGFAAWTQGEPLDAASLLHSPDGRPRLSILSIAHLSDAERMFFVTALLNELLGWMRAQPGTSSLRALFYMDEIFGFFPPIANPPSKTPMLTLLKQARAFGLGIVLATQNPVDLDYKGLSNAGTWFLGRLQTERDKARVIEGLEGAAAGAKFDRQELEKMLAGLQPRVFLMQNVHEDGPVLLQTRWLLSYLRGPLTRAQIQSLKPAGETPFPKATGPARTVPTSGATGSGARGRGTPTESGMGATVPGGSARFADSGSMPSEGVGGAGFRGVPLGSAVSVAATAGSFRPVVPAEAGEVFLAPSTSGAAAGAWVPMILAESKVHYAQAKAGVDLWQDVTLLAPLPTGGDEPDWNGAGDLTSRPVVGPAPGAGARFLSLPAAAARPKSYAAWRTALARFLYQSRPLALFEAKELKQVSRPGETEGEFRARLSLVVREKRDREVDRLRSRYAPKLAALQEQTRRAAERVDREQSQVQQQTMQTAISVGATVFGALFGRKTVSVGTLGRATTAMRGVGRTAREREDVGRAREDLEAAQGQLRELEATFSQETVSVQAPASAADLIVEPLPVAARKADIAIGRLVLAWVPVADSGKPLL